MNQEIKTKEEILGLSFYPHECGSMIECITKQDALKAMEQYARNRSIEFETWKADNDYERHSNGFYSKEHPIAGKQTWFTLPEIYELFSHSIDK